MSVCGERRTPPSHGDSRTICFVRRAWRRGRGGDDMDYGVWGAGDRGGGTSSPSPLAPPPTAISPRSSTWGDPGETPDTAAHLISQALPPPGVGRGRSAAGAGGVGVPAETYGYLLPQARAGWGLPAEGYGYPLLQALAGWGLPAEGYGYLLPQARPGWRRPAEGYGYLLPKARVGRGCRARGVAGRKERRPSATLRLDIDHDRGESDEGDCTDEEGDLSCAEGFTPDVQGGVCPVAPAEHARVGALALLV